MADGYTEFTKETIQSPDGINQLNRILRTLYENVAGDGESIRVFTGYGSPEGIVTAGVGSIYLRADGGANTSTYRKESGTGNAGWIADSNITLPLGTANGGLGADASGWTSGNIIYLSALGVISHQPFSSFSGLHGIQIFNSSGTFIAPIGITEVCLTMIGGGASGAGSANAGGGSGGSYIINKPYTVVPTNSYNVTIGAGGNGTASGDGNAGGTTTFDAFSVPGGNPGLNTGVGGTSSGGFNSGTTTASGSGTTTTGLNYFASGNGSGKTSGGVGGGGGGTPFGVGTDGVDSGGTSADVAANTGAGSGGARGGTSGKGGSGFVIVIY